MTDYYGSISALGVCAEIWVFSGMYVRGDIRSNDLGIANKLTDGLSEVVKDVAQKTYDIHTRQK